MNAATVAPIARPTWFPEKTTAITLARSRKLNPRKTASAPAGKSVVCPNPKNMRIRNRGTADVAMGRATVNNPQTNDPTPKTIYGPNRSTITPMRGSPAVYDQFQPDKTYPIAFGEMRYISIKRSEEHTSELQSHSDL